MTEEEWLECTDPTPVLEFLRGKASDRKMRLFAVACCRRLRLNDEKMVTVRVAERFAEGIASVEELRLTEAAARKNADEVRRDVENDYRDRCSYCAIGGSNPTFDEWSICEAECIADCARNDAFVAAVSASKNAISSIYSVEEQNAERVAQSGILRDLIGNPFRPVTINPNWLAWNDKTISRIAQVIYEEHAFDRMPILADALMDAGCDIEETLNHYRSDSPHVKGCWVADLLLGEEYDKAIGDYSQAIRLNPNNVQAILNRGAAYAEKQEYEKAVADYSQAIWFDLKSVYAFFYNRGTACCEKQEYDKAIVDFSEANRLDPKNANAFVSRGRAYCLKKDYDKAIADCSEAIRLDPMVAHHFNLRGFAYHEKEEYEKAIADWSEAMRLDPNNVYAFASRGAAYAHMKEYDKAIADFCEANRLDPVGCANLKDTINALQAAQ